ncbi:ERC protein 2-like, partial [Clarias magur]
HLQMTIQALQEELCSQRHLNELLQQDTSAVSLGSPPDCFSYLELTEENVRYLQAEHEQQTKELFLLKKTVEEMEQHMKKQKQMLSSRDESIKKMLEMLQEKGITWSQLPDKEGLRVCCAGDALCHLGDVLEQKDQDNKNLRA